MHRFQALRPFQGSSRLLLAALLLGLVAGCGGGAPRDAAPAAVVVLSAPLTGQPWVGQFLERGARLAVEQVNAAGGVATADGQRRLQLEVRDNAGLPSRAAAHAREAVSQHAVLLLTDGTGFGAVADITDPARLPVVVCFDGGEDVIDVDRHPTLFRMAPANQPMARRLADYVANSRPRMAVLTDTSEYGQQGRAALQRAFSVDRVEVVSDEQVPPGASDLTPQVLAARRAGADHLVVWSDASNVAAVVQAARANGWTVPVLSGPTGEDPLVRQRLAAHRDWVDGLTFVSFRITSEVGPAPYAAYRQTFTARYGVEPVGVEQDGRQVVQPPDWSMFTFDLVHLAAMALVKRPATGPGLMTGLESTAIIGANGDERGYTPRQHEGVNPSDMYFGRFAGFIFAPVTDDPLSESLVPVDQLAS